MGAHSPDIDRIEEKLALFFDGFQEDMQAIGEVAAEGIIQNTLSGIGADDQPFQQYSQSYQALIEAVGGKAQEVVNLRGVFYHDGQKQKRFRSALRRLESRAGRRAYITVTIGDRSFTAKTAATRPAVGLNDPLSEMSLDRIVILPRQDGVRLVYIPREKPYMMYHNDGDGKLPKREWFTIKRASIMAAITEMLRTMLAARVARFNRVLGQEFR